MNPTYGKKTNKQIATNSNNLWSESAIENQK